MACPAGNCGEVDWNRIDKVEGQIGTEVTYVVTYEVVPRHALQATDGQPDLGQ